MLITDPRTEAVPRFVNPFARMLNDPRDVVFVALMLRCALFGACGVSLFFVGDWVIYLAPVYWVALFGLLMDRFTLMLHCTSHRQLFNKQYRSLNYVIPWLLGPFFGQTPNTYFAHHMGMHHREENLSDDLSTTLPFQRDRLDHWLRYYLRFLFIGLPELGAYFARRKQWKFVARIAAGEGVYWALIALLLWVNPLATVVVFCFPLLAIRTAMMMGNWAQHSFVCAEHPEDPYRSSITCINTRYNRRCFNDGYHILHHVKPRCHWSEHPDEFLRALPEYARHDAIVFDGIDYFQIWLYLMLGKYDKLAGHFVVLPGAPQRSRAEVIEFLRQRVRHAPEAQRELGLAGS